MGENFSGAKDNRHKVCDLGHSWHTLRIERRPGCPGGIDREEEGAKEERGHQGQFLQVYVVCVKSLGFIFREIKSHWGFSGSGELAEE